MILRRFSKSVSFFVVIVVDDVVCVFFFNILASLAEVKFKFVGAWIHSTQGYTMYGSPLP